MNPSIFSRSIMRTLPLIGAGLVALSGCGNGNGQDRQAETRSTNASVQLEVAKAQQELSQVRTSLEHMSDAKAAVEPETLTSDLVTRMDAMDESIDQVIDSCTTAIAAGRHQSAAWHAKANTFTDPGLRNASNIREGELRSAVNALAASHAQLITARVSFDAQISQILSALDLDNSPAGLQSVEPIITRLLADEPVLRESLTAVTEKSAAITTPEMP